MTTDLFTKLTSDAETRFDKDIKNANIKRSLETQFGVKKPDPGLKKSDPSEYAKQDAAHKNFMKMPAADREKYN